MHKKSKYKQKGFTLIELLVVLAILAALTLMAVIKMTQIIDTANQRVDISNVSYLNSATRVYRVEVGDWPGEAGELVPDYIDGIPNSPTGGTYEYDVANNEFVYVAPE
jgi:prepilin-type N-terminal cleavage/methylation domain-containing protein